MRPTIKQPCLSAIVQSRTLSLLEQIAQIPEEQIWRRS